MSAGKCSKSGARMANRTLIRLLKKVAYEAKRFHAREHELGHHGLTLSISALDMRIRRSVMDFDIHASKSA